MKLNKILFLIIVLIGYFIAVSARQIEVLVETEGLVTRNGGKISEYQVIEIPDTATYGQVRKAIAKAFKIDPDWRNFTIKYVDTKTGLFYFLKPKIEKLTPIKRTAFFNNIAAKGFKGIPTIIIAKRYPSEIKGGKIQEAKNREMTILPINTTISDLPIETAPTDIPEPPMKAEKVITKPRYVESEIQIIEEPIDEEWGFVEIEEPSDIEIESPEAIKNPTLFEKMKNNVKSWFGW